MTAVILPAQSCHLQVTMVIDFGCDLYMCAFCSESSDSSNRFSSAMRPLTFADNVLSRARDVGVDGSDSLSDSSDSCVVLALSFSSMTVSLSFIDFNMSIISLLTLMLLPLHFLPVGGLCTSLHFLHRYVCEAIMTTIEKLYENRHCKRCWCDEDVRDNEARAQERDRGLCECASNREDPGWLWLARAEGGGAELKRIYDGGEDGGWKNIHQHRNDWESPWNSNKIYLLHVAHFPVRII